MKKPKETPGMVALMATVTVEELRDFRAKLGFALNNTPEDQTDRMLALAGIYWLLRRRVEPEYQYEQAIKHSGVKLAEMIEAMIPDAEAEEDDPLPVGGPGSDLKLPPPAETPSSYPTPV